LKRRLVVTADAERQIRAASDWWYENRRNAPQLFRSELQRAFELVVDYPDAAPLATNPELPGVRRVLLRRTRFYLYYQAGSDVVEILALWHASRGDTAQL
jgi:plasmid stabilization system protein ParE